MAREIYRRVMPRIWSDPDIKKRLSRDEKAFLLYLVTNPHSHPAGIYRLPLIFVQDELGFTPEESLELLQGPLAPFAVYDPETEEVFVRNMALHQFGGILPRNDKRNIYIERQVASIRSDELVNLYLEAHAGWFFHIDDLKRHSDTPPDRQNLPSDENPHQTTESEAPSQAPSQGASEGPCEASISVSVSTSTSSSSLRSSEDGASPDVESSPEDEWGEFAKWFREEGHQVLWGGPEPPSWAENWSINRDLSVCKKLYDQGEDLEIIQKVIEQSNESNTMAYFWQRGRRDRWYVARAEALKALDLAGNKAGSILREMLSL